MAMFDTLDITKSDLVYDKLVKHIDELVLETQNKTYSRILPNILLMTKKQQKMLRRYPQCKAMFGTTQKHWLTPHNVMECAIVQPETIKE